MDGNSDTITDEYIKRIESERKEINSAYEKGCDVLNEKKNDITLAARTDRYGFIHEKNLPTQLTEDEKMRNDKEKSREKKWLDMLENWSKYTKSEVKLEERVFKGIPNSIRSRAWYKLLDIDNQKQTQAGVYEKMKESGRKYSLDLRQIDLDINRTFRDNIAYKERYCHRQVQLYNVLAAYSIYNTEIGYCQGMSGITALLLMYLSDEESTFWALSELMSNTKYAMHGMFKKDFPKLLRYSDKHDKIIEQMLPKIYKKLKKCNISAMLYTTKWFLQCYLDALPFSLVLRIWDIYLLKGDNILIAMSYCILKVHSKRLKKLDMDTINEFLKNKLPDDFGLSDDKAIECLKECIDELKEYGLGISTKQIIPPIELPQQPFGHVDKITREKIINNQKKPSMDQIVEQFKTQSITTNLSTINNNNNNIITDSTLSFKSSDSSLDYEKDDLNPSRMSDYDKEDSPISDLTNSRHSSINNDDYVNNDNVLNINKSQSEYDNLDSKFNYINNKLKNTESLNNNNNIIIKPPKSPNNNNFNSNNNNNNNNNNNSELNTYRSTVIVKKNFSNSNGRITPTINNNNNKSDIYALRLDSEFDKEENINIKKNPTQIVRHKDNNEFIGNQHGIYYKSIRQSSNNNNSNKIEATKTKKTNKHNLNGQDDYI